MRAMRGQSAMHPICAMHPNLAENPMTPYRSNRFTLIAVAALATLTGFAGCSSVPTTNARLDEARMDYQAVQASPQATTLAGSELKLASDALGQASAALASKASPAEVDQLAYLARQRVAIARETLSQKTAQQAVAGADAERDKLRLAARTNEANTAQRGAESAQRQAEAAQRDAEASKRQADAAQTQAAAAQMQANDAQARSQQLAAQIKALNATKTDRGLVVTLGDVLFDTNQAQLKVGGQRSVDKLVAFLKDYPQRKALIEGFTDSIGGADMNQALSGRRAEAVRMALLDQGVAGNRITTRGYGEAYPVAGNETAGGRQANRRVEIILSDDTGAIAPR